ncbi:CG14913 [Drosophila busckii]|uniref:CG14913 n=2 Tax=Drosophila busckii TaxID=30019 RepID=A0A0M4EQE4_DROBS|nr:CG14913 [Drosophila busckii]
MNNEPIAQPNKDIYELYPDSDAGAVQAQNTDEFILIDSSEVRAKTTNRDIVSWTNTKTRASRPTTTRLRTRTTTTTRARTTTTKASTTTSRTPSWLTLTPHPPKFFNYPLATCQEQLNLHEVFGVLLARDRGLPTKVMCRFRNDWGGPWLLMNRMELPVRVHMRHWFFGYVTEDYKDLNINFLGLAHIMNSMRVAMLILGQDNNNQLVYNLYDDVVISGFDDLFMLRKAHLIAANTTDLLFTSVGQPLISHAGHNRSCPFDVLGGWWGTKWQVENKHYCVFPIERNVSRPGYMAMFIKPSPFAINNTALYGDEITTRRPWATTINQTLMDQADGDLDAYNRLNQALYERNKLRVQHELLARIKLLHSGNMTALWFSNNLHNPTEQTDMGEAETDPLVYQEEPTTTAAAAAAATVERPKPPVEPAVAAEILKPKTEQTTEVSKRTLVASSVATTTQEQLQPVTAVEQTLEKPKIPETTTKATAAAAAAAVEAAGKNVA